MERGRIVRTALMGAAIIGAGSVVGAPTSASANGRLKLPSH